MSVGGGKGKSSSKSRVQIPAFLKPFLNQATSTAGGALRNLQFQAGGDLVAPFTPAQQLAQALGINLALDPNSPIDQATNAVSGLVQNDALPGTDILSMLSGGSAVPQASIDTLTAATQGGALPGQDALSQLLGQNAIPQQTIDTLQRTAAGDFLMGGEGFDAAVDAAVRAAMPNVISTFGRGVGGATGGLAQTAIAQSGIDAFARQFANERQNQLGAANTLGQLGLAGQGQQADIAQALATLGLNQGAQQIGAAGTLGQLGLSGAGLQGDLASALANLGLAGRQQQLGAAALLPELATADINLLSGIGGDQQALNQARIDAPFNAQMALLQAALGGLPISSLLGQDSKGKQRGFTFGLEL